MKGTRGTGRDRSHMFTTNQSTTMRQFVYVVQTRTDYEGGRVVGIYSTEVDATARVETIIANGDTLGIDGISITRWDTQTGEPVARLASWANEYHYSDAYNASRKWGRTDTTEGGSR